MIPKFRAWHKISEVMVTNIINVLYDKNGDFLGIKTPHNAPFHRFFPASDIELMMSTGLKDINGNKLYDRDIVQLNTRNNKQSQRITRQVVHRNGNFYVLKSRNGRRTTNKKILFAQMIYNAQLIKIGDFFQNPELRQP